MAITYVGGGKASSGSPITVTYTTTAGNLLVLVAGSWSATASFAISDSASQTWTAGAKVTQSTYTYQLFYKENSAATTWQKVTITNPAGTSRLSVGEWSGVKTSGAYEAHAEASNASDNALNSGNFTVTDGDLIVGGLLGGSGSLAAGSGFTLHAATSDGTLGLESKTNSGTTAAATGACAWGVWICLGAGFMPAASSCADPSISPSAGTWRSGTAARSVTITDATSGASIRYTTDGSTPSDSSGTVYSGAFDVSTTTTVRAIAYKAGLSNSNVVSTTYTYRAAQTFYVSAAGSDSNAGTSTGASWAHAPGQTGATGTPASAALVGDDQILFNMGDTWSNSTVTMAYAGDSGHNIVLGAYGTGAKPIIAASANQPTITLTASKGYWTIDGLDLRATGQVSGINESLAIYWNYWSGADMGAVPGWIVQNCNFTAGLCMSGPGLIVQDNTFDGTGNANDINGAICVRGSETAGTIIRRNTIHNWIDRGIWVFGAPSTTAPSVTVNNNTIYTIAVGSNQAGVGINFDGAANYVESGVAYLNTIYSCDGYGMSHENCVNQQTYQNLIHDVGSIGMTFMHYGAWRNFNMNSVVHHNIIYNTNIGLCLIYGAYWSFYNNVIYGDTGTYSSGFKVLDNTTYTNHLNFENNIIAGGWDYPINVPDNAAIWTALDYNCTVPSTTTVMLQIVGGAKTLAQVQALGYMTHGFTTDPLFVSPTTDFSLQSASPCRNAGTNVGLTTDYAGHTIGSLPDIGAYELPSIGGGSLGMTLGLGLS